MAFFFLLALKWVLVGFMCMSSMNCAILNQHKWLAAFDHFQLTDASSHRRHLNSQYLGTSTLRISNEHCPRLGHPVRNDHSTTTTPTQLIIFFHCEIRKKSNRKKNQGRKTSVVVIWNLNLNASAISMMLSICLRGQCGGFVVGADGSWLQLIFLFGPDLALMWLMSG